LAEEGADIIAVDYHGTLPGIPYALSTSEDLENTVRLVKNTGRRIVARTADVRDHAAMQSVVEEGLRELGRLDIVLPNAGVLTLGSSVELTQDQWCDTLDVNLSGVWNTIQPALKPMIDQRSGCIILTSSLAGLRGQAGILPYVAAKWALVGVTRALANELGPAGIRVNAIHPTNVRTPMLDNEPTRRAFRPDLDDPQMEDCAPNLQLMNVLPIPYVEPRDISAAVVWLASDEARYVTGISLPVDAGASIR
jgi:(+)-trans-carveol dehydrogenase